MSLSQALRSARFTPKNKTIPIIQEQHEAVPVPVKNRPEIVYGVMLPVIPGYVIRYVQPKPPRGADIEEIILHVAMFYGLDVADIKSDYRPPEFTLARHVVSYLCKKILKRSSSLIGEVINKDQSCVSYGHRQIADAIAKGDEIAKDVQQIAERFAASRKMRL